MAATRRQQLIELLTVQPRSVSALALALGLERGDVADHLTHAIRSARAAGARIRVLPASCRKCGFTFGADRLEKPGRCPQCGGSRLFEAQVSIER